MKNANMDSVIKSLSLFSTLSIMPSLKITVGTTANNAIIIMMMAIQDVLMISARVYTLDAGSFEESI